jgi:CheY-like chemotaxis protein
VSLPPEPVWLDADPVRLAQVFVNLLNNASKFTDRGGRIRVTAERTATGVAVTVADTGIGIAPEQLSRIFEMFTQARSSPTDPQPGFGIGLALARGLVEMHGGRIEACSAGPGQGSAFIVRLPVVDAAFSTPPSQAGGAVAHTAGAARRILVVDDEQMVAKSLAVLLGILGHAVEVAHDGLEGIAAAERRRPDVILLDIGMPKLDGYAACRAIREQPWGKTIQIVALTGWGTEEDRRRSAEAGFDAHLVKPVDASTLAQLLDEAPAAKG